MVNGTRGGKLRISELARRADVPRATIQFYVREGLLPAPVKTGRTMAYYDPDCVDRVTLMKELQRRYLPLGVIRRLLARGAGAHVAEVARGRIRGALQPSERAMPREEALTEIRIREGTIAGLERLGLLPKGESTFAPLDVAILRAISKLQASGVNEDAGFGVTDVALYRDAMASLLDKEVAAFGRSLARRSSKDVVRLAVASAMGATELMLAIRGKLIDQLVATKASKGKSRGKR